jgi:DNA-binding NarL/FixJ family response regulator
MIRVALVEDQALVRAGLRTLLALFPGLEVVAEARDGEEALRVLPGTAPDVVLMDVRMPGRTGIQVLEELGRRGQVLPTILLTTFDDDSAALAGIRAGARGFLLKDVTPEELVEAVRTVAAGGTLLRPSVTERAQRTLEQRPSAFPASELPDRLTPRELDVLRLMAGGYSNREIADALGMAEGTVKNHASSVLSKLGVRDRTRAVLRALELGLL